MSFAPDLATGKISWLPLGDQQTASSRLRCYSFDRQLRRLGLSSCIGFDPTADFLVIQKRTDQYAFDCIRGFRKFSKRIVFDIDDFPADDNFRVNAKRLASIVDMITTATPEQKALAVKLLGVGPERVSVIPNPVDYDLLEPLGPACSDSDLLTIGWFGNWENFPASLYETVCTVPKAQFCAITNYPDEAPQRYARCRFLSWSLQSFASELRLCDLVVLSHEGNEITRAKSGHKMVTSIMHGVPVVASRTPDYERIATLGRIGDFLFHDTVSLGNCIEKLRSLSSRESYLRRAQERIWQQYRAERVFDGLVEAYAVLNRPMAVERLLRMLKQFVFL